MFKNHILDINPPTYGNQTRVEDMETPNLTHINRLGFQTTLKPGEATLEDIYIHAQLRQRLSPSTAIKRIRTLEYISNHPIPIDISNPTYHDWIRHSDYREIIEGATHALHNEWKAIKTLLTSYGITPWNYQPPIIPEKTIYPIPHPDKVNQMIHNTYTPNKDKNRHLQYLLLFTYITGIRNPSEPCQLRLKDVDLENGTIIITETKKHRRRRMIKPTQQYMTGKNCKSLRYWIDKIRPRYINQHSQDYLWINYTGNPWTKNYLRKYLTQHIQPHYPEYKPYESRHWAATAKLIQEYIDSHGHWNQNKVSRYLGHTDVNTTNQYLDQAETWLEIAPYNWFSHVLNPHIKKTPKNRCKGVKHGCDHELLPLRSDGPVGVLSLLTGEKTNSAISFNVVVESQPSSFFLSNLTPFDMDESSFFKIASLKNDISPPSVYSSISFLPQYLDSPHFSFCISRDDLAGGNTNLFDSFSPYPVTYQSSLHSLHNKHQSNPESSFFNTTTCDVGLNESVYDSGYNGQEHHHLRSRILHHPKKSIYFFDDALPIPHYNQEEGDI